MFEEILPGIYRIEVPIPDNPLQTVNSYLLRGKEEDLIIDTGVDNEESSVVLLSALHKIGAKMDNINIFITHLHYDHFGLAASLASNGSKIYLNARDAMFLGDANLEERDLIHGRLNGFPYGELQEANKNRDDVLNNLLIEDIKKSFEERTENALPEKQLFQLIGDGDTLHVGEYSLRCVMTPGHSSGHLCLYEANNKILFSGDHILEGITPAVFLWPGEKRNPLKEYLNSLDKVFNMEINNVLPGHRSSFQDYRGRISQIKAHHYAREEEIASVLDTKGKSAYQIASKVSWSISESWDRFASELKWMALAETLAHLNYMEENGRIKSKLQSDRVIHYYL
ncbi:MAG: MBL fold metallo-hydrolase [Bacillota bacterium]|nr:MBL fold metallo-hydrolase [Bacillota bacterium]